MQRDLAENGRNRWKPLKCATWPNKAERQNPVLAATLRWRPRWRRR